MSLASWPPGFSKEMNYVDKLKILSSFPLDLLICSSWYQQKSSDIQKQLRAKFRRFKYQGNSPLNLFLQFSCMENNPRTFSANGLVQLGLFTLRIFFIYNSDGLVSYQCTTLPKFCWALIVPLPMRFMCTGLFQYIYCLFGEIRLWSSFSSCESHGLLETGLQLLAHSQLFFSQSWSGYGMVKKQEVPLFPGIHTQVFSIPLTFLTTDMNV